MDVVVSVRVNGTFILLKIERYPQPFSQRVGDEIRRGRAI
jgi:hypothetical protein